MNILDLDCVIGDVENQSRAPTSSVEAGGAYAWIVRTSHGAVLIDAGLDATGAAILAELKAEGVEPGQVQAVLITHGHPDHYAAAGLFEKATVVAGSDDLAMIRGDRTHYSTFGRIVGAVMPLPPAPGSSRRFAAASSWRLTFDTIADGHAGVAFGAKEKLARFLAEHPAGHGRSGGRDR